MIWIAVVMSFLGLFLNSKMTTISITQQQFRDEWVKALRSGEYEQAKCRLAVDGKYCCLGVACEVYNKIFTNDPLVITHNRSDRDPLEEKSIVKYYDDEGESLPPKVMRALGIKGNEGSFSSPGFKEQHLSNLNDFKCYDFNMIADLIESKPEGLFND